MWNILPWGENCFKIVSHLYYVRSRQNKTTVYALTIFQALYMTLFHAATNWKLLPNYQRNITKISQEYYSIMSQKSKPS